MLESLLITLREGIEAALIVAILLTSLKKTHRTDLVVYVYYGLGMAVVASAAGALALQFVMINEEAYEGFLYLTAAVFVGTMLYWMRRHAKTLKTAIETKISSVSVGRHPRLQVWGVFFFTFLMVFREGVETVLFLSAVGLTTEKLLSFIGGSLGLAISAFFCVAFVKGTVRINLARFFQVSTVVLALFILQLLINGLHELSEAQILPSSRLEMAIVGPLVRNNVIFLLAILFIPVLIALTSRRKDRIGALPEAGPQRRLELARLQSQLRWRRSWILATLTVTVFLGAHSVYSSRTRVIDAPLAVEAEEGIIRIPRAEVEDGRLHRYGLEVSKAMIRFIIVKTGEGKYATAFDLCDICGDYGYVQDGENILCLNCVAAIYPPTIGTPGGCNPIPLASSLDGGDIVIRETDLRKLKDRFVMKILPEVRCPVCRMTMHMEEVKETVRVGSKTYYLCPMEACGREFRRRVAENSE